MKTRFAIAAAFLAAACASPPGKPTVPTTPSVVACVIEAGVFAEGLNGTCTATAPGQFDMEFRDAEGRELFAYTWLSEDNRPTADCSSLCSASAFYWAGTPQVALLAQRGQPSNVREPATCDGGTFECLGCCGPGCEATIAVPLGTCGPNNQCILTEFRGLTKTCCQNHDACVLTARGLAGQIACAIIAIAEGCVLKNLWGGGSGDPYVAQACLLP